MECWHSQSDETRTWELPVEVHGVADHLGAVWDDRVPIWACDVRGGLWRLD